MKQAITLLVFVFATRLICAQVVIKQPEYPSQQPMFYGKVINVSDLDPVLFPPKKKEKPDSLILRTPDPGPQFPTRYPLPITYVINSETDLSKLIRLEQHQLESIWLDLNYVPIELIRHGHHLERIAIYSGYAASPSNSQSDLKDTIRNISLLNYLPNLKYVSVFGMNIDHDEQEFHEVLEGISERKRHKREIVLLLENVRVLTISDQLSLHTLKVTNSVVETFDWLRTNHSLKTVEFSNLKETNLDNCIAAMPANVEYLRIEKCPSLTSLVGLERCVALNQLVITESPNLVSFPTNIPQTTWKTIQVQLRAESAKNFLQMLSSATEIDYMELELSKGEAQLNFHHQTCSYDKLFIKGTPYMEGTLMTLSNVENLSARYFTLSGKFRSVPDVSKVDDIEILVFKFYERELADTSIEPLKGLKNLQRFEINNCAINALTDNFFKRNPDLDYLGIIGTDLVEIDFGGTTLLKLKNFTVQNNQLLERISDRSHYPRANFLHFSGNKKEKY